MKKKTIIWLLIIIGLIITLSVSGYVWQKSTNQPSYETFAVKRGELKQEISATGIVKPAQEIALGFEISGKINAVFADIGDTVAKNQTIVRLDSKELQAQLNQASANLEKEIAVLNKLLAGSSPETLAVLETKIANAKITLQDKEKALLETKSQAVADLDNDYSSAQSALFSAHTYADDSLNKQIDELFINDNTSSPTLTFSTSDSKQAQNTEGKRVSAGSALSAIKETVQNLSSSQSQIDIAIIQTETNLTIIKNFLNQLADTLNIAIGLSSTTLTTYKGYVNTARSNIDTALSAITTAKQNITVQKATNQAVITTAQANLNTAKNNLNLAEKELALEKAGATKEEIETQEAVIKAASANITNLQAKIEKTILKAPIKGVITKQSAKIGENVSAGIILVEIATQNNLETEALINEIDIIKIKPNQVGQITLDAFGEDIVFDAEVISIEPSQTTIQDVVYYKVKLAFNQENEDIKPGMTADIAICANKKEDVLYIPPRAIKTNNGEKYVEILVSKKPEKRFIETGIRGNEGIEILSGLQEGDLVITFVNVK